MKFFFLFLFVCQPNLTIQVERGFLMSWTEIISFNVDLLMNLLGFFEPGNTKLNKKIPSNHLFKKKNLKKDSFRVVYSHTHTHTRVCVCIYIYIYICVCVCVLLNNTHFVYIILRSFLVGIALFFFQIHQQITFIQLYVDVIL